MSASLGAVGKQRGQEENGAAVKTACKGKLLMKTKAVQEGWGSKQTKSDVDTIAGGEICFVPDANAFLLLLFISVLDLLFKSCCVNSAAAVVECSA